MIDARQWELEGTRVTETKDGSRQWKSGVDVPLTRREGAEGVTCSRLVDSNASSYPIVTLARLNRAGPRLTSIVMCTLLIVLYKIAYFINLFQ